MSSSVEIPIWLHCVQAIELCLIVVFVCFAVIAGAVVNQHRLFHSNLRLLMNAMGASYFLLTLSRAGSILAQFYYAEEKEQSTYILILERPHVYFEAGRTFSVALGLSAAILMIFERLAASLFLDTYERRKHTFLVLCGLCLLFPVNSILAYFMLFVEYGWIVALVGGFIGVSVFMTFMLVDRWNRYRLNIAIKHGFNYTLTQRFQLSENIRAAEIICKTVMSCSIGSIVIVVLFICYRFGPTPTEIFILRAVFNLYASCFTFSMIILTILRTHRWRVSFFQKVHKIHAIFCKHRLRIGPDKKTPVQAIVQNSDGRQLAFDTKKESELYFKQLAVSWGN